MEINEEVNEANEGFTNQLQKPKKPRTEKQKEALKKAQLKRKENLEKRRLEKEALKNQQINPSLNGMNEDYEEVNEENLDCNKVGVPNNNGIDPTIIQLSNDNICNTAVICGNQNAANLLKFSERISDIDKASC